MPMPDDMNISDSEDTNTAHLPNIKAKPNWLRPVPEEDRPTSPEPDWTGNMSSFINWFCKRIGKKKPSKADLEGPAFKVVQPFHENIISLQFQIEEYHLLVTDQVDLVNHKGHRVVPDMSKPSPLGGPPGRRSALSISKLKVARYLEFRLEELVPSLWIKSEREYDISATYGISYWWFKCKELYITRHSASSDRNADISHMRILSVVSLKTYERYGYTFLKEYKILKADFKNLHPNDFKDLSKEVIQTCMMDKLKGLIIKQKFSNKLKYPHLRKTFVPSGVLTKIGLTIPVKQNEKRAVHIVSTARPVYTARPFSTVRPFAPKIAQTSDAIRPIYPRIDNVRPRGSYSPIKRSYYTKPAFRPKDLKQDVKTFWVQNMTTTGTRAVVNTGKGKMDIDLKKSRWVWRPKGNYLDHVSKDSGSFMLKKGNPEILLQDHAGVDSGCSSHMTGNKAYLSDYEDFNGGFVAFGSDPKGV
ncbi:hypothetical protein Tco_1057849 [Tanacetum coccineum]|uniref:Uncharacterized protein n=1 Tax=Tanacetum coccineum TaxID=301880 RepID=A0ABQ5H6J4_9ASTR